MTYFQIPSQFIGVTEDGSSKQNLTPNSVNRWGMGDMSPHL